MGSLTNDHMEHTDHVEDTMRPSEPMLADVKTIRDGIRRPAEGEQLSQSAAAITPQDRFQHRAVTAARSGVSAPFIERRHPTNE